MPFFQTASAYAVQIFMETPLLQVFKTRKYAHHAQLIFLLLQALNNKADVQKMLP